MLLSKYATGHAVLCCATEHCFTCCSRNALEVEVRLNTLSQVKGHVSMVTVDTVLHQ